MLVNLLDKNSAKILLFLAISPGSNYTRKEIKEKTEMNNIPLDVSLTKLLNLRLINENKRLYFLNLDNFLIQQILQENSKIKHLPLKIQFILLDFIGQAIRFKNINQIILFGSYSKLIFSDKSDIDLAIIAESRHLGKIEKLLTQIASKISKKHKKEIQLHFFSEQDMKHKEDALIKDILRNKIILI